MTEYDYERQAWIVDGRYVDCAHPAGMACNCYGRSHAGALALIDDAPAETYGTARNRPAQSSRYAEHEDGAL